MTATAAPPIPMIPVDRITPTPDNPRIFRDGDPKLKELCESIRRHGVLQPIFVRPLGDGWELRAGERRWRAARMAGLTEIPAVVRELDDHAALEVTVTENLQRDDLHPLEEANGICSLIGDNWTIEQVANQLGKSVKWVARRASLGKLSKKWRAAIGKQGDPIGDLSANHLELVARMPEAVQDDILSAVQQRLGWNGVVTVPELRQIGADYMMVLDSAPWEKKDAQLLPEAGACTNCLKRSSCNQELFDPEDFGEKKKGPKDSCLDPVCFGKKKAAFVKARIESLKAESEKPPILLDKYGDQDELKELGRLDVRPYYHFHEVKKTDPKAQPALIVAGAEAGKTIYVKPTSYGSSPSAAKPKASELPAAEQLKAKREQLRKLQGRIVTDALRAILNEWTEGPGKKAPRYPFPVFDDAMLVRLASVFGTFTKRDSVSYQIYDLGYKGLGRPWKVLEKKDQDLCRKLLTCEILKVLGERLKWFDVPHWDEIKDVAELLQIDLEPLWEQARQQKPEPKSWAKLELVAKQEAKEKKPAKAKKAKPAPVEEDPEEYPDEEE
jgi:ParB/RepB/Spo0J family partition protein